MKDHNFEVIDGGMSENEETGFEGFGEMFAEGESEDIERTIRAEKDPDQALNDIAYLINFTEKHFPDADDQGRINIAKGIERMKEEFGLTDAQIDARFIELYGKDQAHEESAA